MVLEGFEAYLATGFEADGGSIEGIGYWNYGLMYYVTLAELLRERTGGELDLLAAPRLGTLPAIRWRWRFRRGPVSSTLAMR